MQKKSSPLFSVLTFFLVLALIIPDTHGGVLPGKKDADPNVEPSAAAKVPATNEPVVNKESAVTKEPIVDKEAEPAKQHEMVKESEAAKEPEQVKADNTVKVDAAKEESVEEPVSEAHVQETPPKNEKPAAPKEEVAPPKKEEPALETHKEAPHKEVKLDTKHEAPQPDHPAQPAQPEHPKEPEHAEQKEHEEKAEPEKYRLGKDPTCINDVNKLCTTVKKDNNFAVFVCLQEHAERDMDDVSDECHGTMWQYKRNLTMDLRFDEAVFKMCGEEAISRVPDCNINMPPDGSLVNCLVEHRDQIADQKCHGFLAKMSQIIFSDYRLIKGFYQDCAVDVKKLSCGQITAKDAEEHHSQGEVIACLEDEIDKVSAPCQKAILRAAELQSDDFHLDRPLFHSCQEARERFCHDVKSGEGRVYKCLMKHMSDPDMNMECTRNLQRRAKLIQKDVGIAETLWNACKADNTKYKCQNYGSTEHGQASNMLLCLQNEVAQGNPVDPACEAEMREFSILIFEQYELSPVLVGACDGEIEHHCKHLVGRKQDGAMMGCLMDLATNNSVTEKCYEAISEVLKETNAGNDYRVDRPLYDACEPVIAELCAGKNDAMILGCLMDNAHNAKMPKTCAKHVFALQYFLSRDFTLDAALFKDCHEDADRLCSAPSFKDGESKDHQLPHGVVLACLYRGSLPHVEINHRVSPVCGDHVRRVMHQRAVSIKLLPHLEEPCMTFLAKFCLEKGTKEGEEIECLQDNYEQLDKKCQEAIAEFTEQESLDFDLDRHLVDKCANMVSKFCQAELESGESDTIIPCMVQHKNDMDMAPACTTALEHWQIIEMKDFKFSAALKQKCMNDVMDFCRESKSKYEALKCLSQKMVQDSDKSSKDVKKVSSGCKKQVKYELMVQSENIELNHPLYEACKKDLEKWCPEEAHHQGKAEECLRRNRKKLQSHECRTLLFEEEEIESKDRDLDYTFMHVCKRMIKKYCMHPTDPDGILECLRDHIRDPDMDKKCHEVIKEREEEAAESIVLDPELVHECKADIHKFCGDLERKYLTPGKEKPDDGLVFECLVDALQDKMKRLTRPCETLVRRREAEAVLDKDLNPQLLVQCGDEITRLCENEPDEDLIECLKTKVNDVKSKGCREEIKRLIVAGMEDVHIDPALEDACSRDISVFCRDQPKKDGKVLLCLIDVYKAENLHLTSECSNFLVKRISLYQSPGLDLTAFETLSGIVHAVNISPNRNYIYMITLCVLTVLFLGGAYLGRITKRVRQEIKNR